MVQTRTRDYSGEEDQEVAVHVEEGREEPTLLSVRVDPLKSWRISVFNDMEDHSGGSMVRDRYSGRAEGVAFNDWKTRFRSWQRNALFNDWWAFEQLPTHLEFEALQAYDSWFEDHRIELEEVEDYWARRVELVTALKEGAAFPAAQASKTSDGDEEKGEEATSGPDAARAARLLSKAAMSGASGTATTYISRLARASNEAIATMGPPPQFDPLRLFFEHLEMEFGGIRRDRMRHIQDFKKETGDTPHIMYARLSKFARESGDAFTERQLVELYMGKQDKKIRDMAHPHMLLAYGGRATLAQAFAIVEQLNRGLCVEEAGRLSSIMTSTSSQTKVVVGSSNKSQGNPKASKKIAMVAEVEVTANSRMQCWNCGLLGHGKKDCPTDTSSKGKSGGQSASNKGNATTTNRGQQKKVQGGGTPPKCTYAPCGRVGHMEDKCWVKNPQLRPQSFTPQGAQGGGSNSGGNNLEARMGELQNTLALLVAATTRITPGW